MDVYELQIEGTESERGFAAARWELFQFHEIRHVCRLGSGGHVALLYNGEPTPAEWVEALRDAGFPATTLEARNEPREAA